MGTHLSLTAALVVSLPGRGSPVTLGERDRAYCPSTRPFVNCSAADPCAYSKPCQTHPHATCRSDFCGGCVAKFYVDGREVHCENDVGVVCELKYTGFGCYSDKVISVKWANYGRRNTQTCRHAYDADSMHNATDCIQPKTTDIVKHLCDGMSECYPDVSNAVFGDPCYAIYKYLEVDFHCVSKFDVGFLTSGAFSHRLLLPPRTVLLLWQIISILTRTVK